MAQAGKKGKKGGKGGKKGDPLPAQATANGKGDSGGKGKKGKKGGQARSSAAPPLIDDIPETSTVKVHRSSVPDEDKNLTPISDTGSSKMVFAAGIFVTLAVAGVIVKSRRKLSHGANADASTNNLALGESDDDEMEHEDPNLCDSPSCIICKFRSAPSSFLPPSTAELDAIDQAIAKSGESSGSSSWEAVSETFDKELGPVEV